MSIRPFSDRPELNCASSDPSDTTSAQLSLASTSDSGIGSSSYIYALADDDEDEEDDPIVGIVGDDRGEDSLDSNAPSTGADSFSTVKKRTRKLTTPHQLSVLNALLAETRFPSAEVREKVAKEIGMSPRRVQVWFQNRRQDMKRQRDRASVPTDTTPESMSPTNSGAAPWSPPVPAADRPSSYSGGRHYSYGYTNPGNWAYQTSTSPDAASYNFAPAPPLINASQNQWDGRVSVALPHPPYSSGSDPIHSSSTRTGTIGSVYAYSGGTASHSSSYAYGEGRYDENWDGVQQRSDSGQRRTSAPEFESRYSVGSVSPPSRSFTQTPRAGGYVVPHSPDGSSHALPSLGGATGSFPSHPRLADSSSAAWSGGYNYGAQRNYTYPGDSTTTTGPFSEPSSNRPSSLRDER